MIGCFSMGVAHIGKTTYNDVSLVLFFRVLFLHSFLFVLFFCSMILLLKNGILVKGLFG
jgi:hypothetical protein